MLVDWGTANQIPFPLSRNRERKLGKKRRRSMFEPIPNNFGFDWNQLSLQARQALQRRLTRTSRFFERAGNEALQRAPNQAAWDAIRDPNGTYQTLVGPQARMNVIRSFGFIAAADRRHFFEDTGRLSFVIYRWRVALRRRFVKIYQQLRLWGLPRELTAKAMTYYRDALPGLEAANDYALPGRRHPDLWLNRFRHLDT